MYLVFTFLLFSVETDYEDESVMETEQSSVEVELQVCGCVHHYNMSKNILCRDGSGKNWHKMQYIPLATFESKLVYTRIVPLGPHRSDDPPSLLANV